MLFSVAQPKSEKWKNQNWPGRPPNHRKRTKRPTGLFVHAIMHAGYPASYFDEKFSQARLSNGLHSNQDSARQPFLKSTQGFTDVFERVLRGDHRVQVPLSPAKIFGVPRNVPVGIAFASPATDDLLPFN